VEIKLTLLIFNLIPAKLVVDAATEGEATSAWEADEMLMMRMLLKKLPDHVCRLELVRSLADNLLP
jgi:hypothetical protein